MGGCRLFREGHVDHGGLACEYALTPRSILFKRATRRKPTSAHPMLGRPVSVISPRRAVSLSTYRVGSLSTRQASGLRALASPRATTPPKTGQRSLSVVSGTIPPETQSHLRKMRTILHPGVETPTSISDRTAHPSILALRAYLSTRSPFSIL